MMPACIILAAGYSSRMGQLKALLPITDDIPLINHLIETLQLGGITDIKLILGYKSDSIRKACSEYQIDIIINDEFAEGMFSSVKCGVEHLNQEQDFLILPVDTPLLNVEELNLLLERKPRNDEVIFPSYHNKKGHPPYISKTCVPRILNHDGFNGLKGVLAQDGIEHTYIEMPTNRLCKDMDTKEDYQEVLKEYAYEKNNETSRCVTHSK